MLPHRHDAQVFAYDLEGRVTMQARGSAAATLVQSGTFYEAPEGAHIVSENSDKQDQAKSLVVMIKDKSKPFSRLTDSHQTEHLMKFKHYWPVCVVLSLIVASIAYADDSSDPNLTGQRRAEAAGRNLIGRPAPELVVKTIDGETIDLSSLYGKKAVYLKFWATWCVPCRQQMPHFQHTFEGEGTDLAVIAINVGFNDSVQQIRKYQKQLGITMPIVFDDDGHLSAAFNVRVTPQHIIIGRDGRIQYVGHLADQQLDSALLAARAPVADGRKVATRHSTSAETKGARRFAVGDQIPNAALPTLDGRRFQFAKQGFMGPTVLVFMSPWCESYLATTRPTVSANCRVAREQVAEISRGKQARWLEVASGLWASPGDLKEYRDNYKVVLPLTLDASGDLFREFGVSETPTIIILNDKNTIVRRINSSEVATLRQVLSGL